MSAVFKWLTRGHTCHCCSLTNNCLPVYQTQVSRAGTSNYTPQMLWDVITCPCPWYLRLAPSPQLHHLHLTKTTFAIKASTVYLTLTILLITDLLLPNPNHDRCEWSTSTLIIMITEQMTKSYVIAVVLIIIVIALWLTSVCGHCQTKRHGSCVKLCVC